MAREESYKTSKHKWTYIWIAIKHFTTPTKVYEICHKQAYEKEDRPILHDLAKYHIIHHTHNKSDNGTRGNVEDVNKEMNKHHHHHHHHHHHSDSQNNEKD